MAWPVTVRVAGAATTSNRNKTSRCKKQPQPRRPSVSRTDRICTSEGFRPSADRCRSQWRAPVLATSFGPRILEAVVLVRTLTTAGDNPTDILYPKVHIGGSGGAGRAGRPILHWSPVVQFCPRARQRARRRWQCQDLRVEFDGDY